LEVPMKAVLVIVSVGLCGLLAACSQESESGGQAASEGTGATSVKSEESGDTVESTVSSDKSDDHLKITFDRKNRSAKIAPKFGQAKTVSVDQVPASAAEANRMIAGALDTAKNAARTDGKSLKTQSNEVPSTGCASKCADACDEAYSQPCLNAACHFGCGVCCTSN
jgi:hypothetical protein